MDFREECQKRNLRPSTVEKLIEVGINNEDSLKRLKAAIPVTIDREEFRTLLDWVYILNQKSGNDDEEPTLSRNVPEPDERSPASTRSYMVMEASMATATYKDDTVSQLSFQPELETDSSDSDTDPGEDACWKKDASLSRRTADISSGDRPYNTEPIRCILIGKTGSGKSATGNTLTGKKTFNEQVSALSTKASCVMEYFEFRKQKVMVVDTPGLFDTDIDEKQIRKEINKAIAITAPGPHVFLIVMKIGRYTREEQHTLNEIQNMFGKNMLTCAILLFSHADELEYHGKPIEKYIQESPIMRSLASDCTNRYIGINNRSKEDDYGDMIREKLLSFIESMQIENGYSIYTNQHYEECERLLKLEEAKQMRKMRRQRKAVRKQANKQRIEMELKKKKVPTATLR